MSANTKSAEAISFASVPAQMVPYWRQPDRWLGAAGMTQDRYDEEMDVVLDSFDGHIHPTIDMLNELPDAPEVKALRAELNRIIRAPFTRPYNPMSLMLEMNRTLVDVIAYYHNSRGKKLMAKPTPAKDLDGLKEISPQNVNQKRAMVLLRILKAKPKEAMHTNTCKLILEGAEGIPLSPEVVRRAMCVLAELYSPVIVYEILGGSYRVRINF